MKSFVIDTIDNREEFNKVLDFLDSVTKEDECEIYLDSFGGSVPYFNSVVDKMNRMVSDGYAISLRIMTAGSMALSLAWQFEGKRILLRGCEGVAHVNAYSDAHVFTVKGKIVERTSDPLRIGRMENDEEQFVYPFLTEEEKTEFLKGRDVYLSEARMKLIFA